MQRVWHPHRVRFAAEFDPRLGRVLRRLSLEAPVAEVCRQLGHVADGLELARPAYSTVRLHVEAERIRRAERDAALEVGARLAFTRSVVPTTSGIAAEYRREVRRRVCRPG